MTDVLIVEDNVVLLESIALELEMRGYEVMQAVDGKNALDILYTAPKPPAIIVSDIAMPNMNGFELLDAVRKEDHWRDIPFIFLTAFDSRNAVHTGKELGVDDYLVKPFDPEHLVIAMENKLNRVKDFQKGAERQMHKAREQLIHMISHELRTPLSSIYGSAELLSEFTSELDDKIPASMVELIRGGARRLNDLINNVLLLVQLDSGHLKQYMEKHNQVHGLRYLVTNACQIAEAELKGRYPTISVKTQMPDHPVLVQGNEEFLMAMFLAPIRNAIAFAPASSEVTVQLMTKDEHALLIVTDHGPGIPEDQREHVWERFVQLERDYYEQQGAGLGLSIARAAARAHGGDCEIRSGEGKGTQFILWLPLAEVEEDTL